MKLVLIVSVLASASCLAESLPLMRVPPDTKPPVIDGRLDDALWADIPPLYVFMQVQPRPGAVATQLTELRLVRIGGVLYGALKASQAGVPVTARTLRRDAETIDFDDHITIVLDPHGRGRNGFIFRINALGAQRDGLIFDGAITRAEWDGRWESAAISDDEGWSAEFAIPLSQLTAAGEGSDWRFNAERYIAHTGERVRLFGAAPEREIDDLAVTQPAPGLDADLPGWGLSLQPAVRWVSERGTAAGTSRQRLEPAIDAIYRLGAGLDATLTLNTDFADTELDDRRINLSRFELFRPEKRRFFAKDSGRFAFGGLDVEDPDLLPFFSRRVGLGRVLDAGVKLSGSVGNVDLGMLGAQVAADHGQPEARVGVMRAAAGIDSRQRVGMIATAGNPDGTPGSQLAGIDYQFRSTEVFGSRTLEAFLWSQSSSNEDRGSGSASGGRVNYPNVGPTGAFSWADIDANFLPALGYLKEAGARRHAAELGWWHLDGRGNSLYPRLMLRERRRHDGNDYSQSEAFGVEFANLRGDYITPELVRESDRLAASYDTLPGVTVPAGATHFSYAMLYAGLSHSRPFSGEVVARSGGFYSGRLQEFMASLRWRPVARWSVAANVTCKRVTLHPSDFTAYAGALSIEHTPDTRRSIALIVQDDNVGEGRGYAVRGRWLIDRGQEVRIAYDHNILFFSPHAPVSRMSVSHTWYVDR